MTSTPVKPDCALVIGSTSSLVEGWISTCPRVVQLARHLALKMRDPSGKHWRFESSPGDQQLGKEDEQFTTRSHSQYDTRK